MIFTHYMFGYFLLKMKIVGKFKNQQVSFNINNILIGKNLRLKDEFESFFNVLIHNELIQKTKLYEDCNLIYTTKGQRFNSLITNEELEKYQHKSSTNLKNIITELKTEIESLKLDNESLKLQNTQLETALKKAMAEIELLKKQKSKFKNI